MLHQSIRSPPWILTLLETLRTFRRRATARAATEALSMATAGFVAIIVVAVLAIVAGLPVAFSRALALASLLLIGGAASVRALRSHRRFRSDDAVARYLEACDPTLRTDLRTALDYRRRPAGDDPDTEGLRALLIHRVDATLRAKAQAIVHWVPRRDLRPYTVAGAATAAALLLAHALAPEPVGGAMRAFAFGSPPDAAVQSEAPIVTAVDLTVRPPAYTGRLAERLRFTTGDVRALAGSEVVVRASTARPVERAAVVVETGDGTERYAATLADPYILEAAFPISDNGTYQFEVELAGGARRADPMERRIRVVPDQAPDVQLTHPERELEVSPDQVVDLVFVASDDFALMDVQLMWAFVGDEDTPRTMPLASGLAVRTHEEHVPFDLRPLLLIPRDELLVWVEATDNNAVAGPQTGSSQTVRLRVASPEDQSEALLAAKEEVFESLLAQLNRSLSAAVLTPRRTDNATIALDPVDAPDGERNARVVSLRVAHAAWADVLAGWEALLDAMQRDPATPAADLAALEASYDQTYAAVRDQAAIVDGLAGGLPPDGLSRSRFDVLARVHAPTVERNERAILILEDLIALQKADDVQRALDELQAIRERLTELLQEYRDTNDPALREQIERELRRLEQRMRELMERIASQVDRLPTEHLNVEAIDPSEVGENLEQMGGALDRVRELLSAGDVEGAIAAMMDLDATLDALQQGLGDPLEEASPDASSAFDEAMSALMDQVNDLEAQEAALLEDTESLRAEMQARRNEEIADARNEALDALRTRAQALRERYEALEREPLGESTQRAMDAVTEGLEAIERQLAQEDLVAAEAAAERVASQLLDASRELRADEALLRRSERGQEAVRDARSANSDALDAAWEMQQQLNALMEASQPRPGPGDRAQMQALSERQQQVRAQLDALGQQVAEMAQRSPEVGQQLGEPIAQVGERMGEAQQALRQGQPRPSIQGQQSALEGLQTLRQQMQQMTQEQRQRERRNGQGRRPDDRVPVPEEGASDRRDYRDRVVDAMREGGLEAYDAEIQEYYETLLR